MKKTNRLLPVLILVISLLLTYCNSKGRENPSEEKSNPDSSSVKKEYSQARDKKEEDKRTKFRKRGNWAPDTGDVAVPVEVTSVVRGSISNFLLYNSTLETEQQVEIFSRVGGVVEAIYVDEGDRVRKGQPLLQIEKREYELAEQKALVEYQKQQANYNRIKALEAENLLSEEEYENARLALKQAEIAWKQAALNLEYTTVKSPINGVVGERKVDVGEWIQSNTPLFTIANLDEKIIRIYVPQDEYPKCYLNQKAVVTTEVIPGKKFRGKVKRISPVIDPQSGTFKLTVAVDDPENLLRPGMFVNVELIVDTHQDALLIPKSALIYENERIYFFIVSADSALKVELQKGFEDAEKVEILNSLPVNTKVVVLGQNGLKTGTKVKVIKEKEYAWQQQKMRAGSRRASSASG